MISSTSVFYFGLARFTVGQLVAPDVDTYTTERATLDWLMR